MLESDGDLEPSGSKFRPFADLTPRGPDLKGSTREDPDSPWISCRDVIVDARA